jgi:hypothetical protein
VLARFLHEPSLEKGKAMLTTPASYRIRVHGRLGPEWAVWFEGLTLSGQEPDQTVLRAMALPRAYARSGLCHAGERRSVRDPG